MMKITGWMTLLFYTALALPAVAGEEQASALDRMYALGREQGPLVMPFTHRRYSALFRQPQTRRGIFYFDGRETAVMYYTEPEPYVFLIRGGEAFHLRKDHPEPQALDLRRAPLMDGLAHMFRMNSEKLKNLFEVSAENAGDGTELIVRLAPLRSAPISQVILRVDQQSGLLRQLRLDETGGESQVIQFETPEITPPEEQLFLPAYWSERLKEDAL